jgi:hypothetical protein
VVAVVDGVVVLASEDLDELGSGVVEAASFADGLELAVEGGRSGAVAVAEQPAMVGGQAAHVRAGRFSGKRLGGPVVVLDGLGHSEVLIGDGSIGDAGVGEGHAHGPVAEQRCDGFEAHPPVDGLGRQGVAQLVWVDVTDAGALGDGDDVAVHGAAVEGLAVIAFDEPPGPGRRTDRQPLGDELDQDRVQGHVAVVVEFADGDA